MTVVAQGFAQVTIDPVKLAAFFASTDGPLYRTMAENGEELKMAAQRRVHVYQGGDPRRTRAPGTLRDSIVKRMGIRDGMPVVEVGSDDEIALIHHEGRRGFGPKNAPRLVFWDGNRQQVISRYSVGPAEPNPYLTDAAAELGLPVRKLI